MSETLQRDVRSSVNEKDRSVEVCWTTGAAVKRYSWDEGYYMEELQVDKKSIRLDRFNAMSLLDTHDSSSMESVLGTVIPGSLRIENGKAYARIKFSTKPRADEVFQDIRDGHPLPISVGYKIHRYEKTEGADGQLPVLRAIDWEPMELSAVPIPADAGAISRNLEGKNMTHPSIRSRRLVTEPSQEGEETRRRGEAESQQDEIRNRSMSVREARGFATEFLRDTNCSHIGDDVQARIKRGMTEQDVRNLILEAMVDQQERSPTFPHSETRDMHDTAKLRRRAMTDALVTRADPSHKPADSSREFMNLTLMEMAREVLSAEGVSVRGMSKGQIAERALHSTSDFPVLLADVGRTLLQEAYRGEPSGIKTVARPSTANDFRPKRSVRLSDWPELKLVNEAGEFTSGTIYETEESYSIRTYGRKIGFTRQLLINDSLNGLIEPARKFARSASDIEAEILASLVISNPKMEDGIALFHADHRNILPASALTVEALSAGRTSIRKQVDEKGKPAGLRAKYLVVPPDLEMEAEKILAQIAAARTEDVNPNAGRLELVVEDRFSDPKAWYLAVDPSSIEALEYAHLMGEEGPQLSERIGFDFDGVEYRCRLDFGAGFLGWRGWYRNAGI